MTKFQNFLESKYFVPVIIVLVAVIGFCLGRISGLQERREPVRVINNIGEVKGVSIDLTNSPQRIVLRGNRCRMIGFNSGE